MAKFCKQCGKKGSIFAGDNFFLNDNEILCYKCAYSVRYNINDLYYIKSYSEFVKKSNDIMECARKNYEEDVVADITAIIEEIYDKKVASGDIKEENKGELSKDALFENVTETKNPKSESEEKVTEIQGVHTEESPSGEFNSRMFSNIGGKIKALATAVTWIGIIASVIGGIVMIATDEDLILPGILTMIVGSLLSWISSFILYGFGQLVENSDKTVKLLEKQNRENKG